MPMPVMSVINKNIPTYRMWSGQNDSHSVLFSLHRPRLYILFTRREISSRIRTKSLIKKKNQSKEISKDELSYSTLLHQTVILQGQSPKRHVFVVSSPVYVHLSRAPLKDVEQEALFPTLEQISALLFQLTSISKTKSSIAV